MTAVTRLLLLCWPIVAAEQSYGALPMGQCPTVAHVMRSAEQLCGGAPVADSLWSVGIRDGGAAAEELLQQHGLWTALDLRVLRAGGPDETELMEHLRAGGISIGDRSKVRLLFGDDGSDSLRSNGDGCLAVSITSTATTSSPWPHPQDM